MASNGDLQQLYLCRDSSEGIRGGKGGICSSNEEIVRKFFIEKEIHSDTGFFLRQFIARVLLLREIVNEYDLYVPVMRVLAELRAFVLQNSRNDNAEDEENAYAAQILFYAYYAMKERMFPPKMQEIGRNLYEGKTEKVAELLKQDLRFLAVRPKDAFSFDYTVPEARYEWMRFFFVTHKEQESMEARFNAAVKDLKKETLHLPSLEDANTAGTASTGAKENNFPFGRKKAEASTAVDFVQKLIKKVTS